MPRSHWEFHVQQAIDEYPNNGKLQRQAISILTDLATIREDSTDPVVISELDIKQTDRALVGRDDLERTQVRVWLGSAERPANLYSGLEREIREGR